MARAFRAIALATMDRSARPRAHRIDGSTASRASGQRSPSKSKIFIGSGGGSGYVATTVFQLSSAGSGTGKGGKRHVALREGPVLSARYPQSKDF